MTYQGITKKVTPCPTHDSLGDTALSFLVGNREIHGVSRLREDSADLIFRRNIAGRRPAVRKFNLKFDNFPELTLFEKV